MKDRKDNPHAAGRGTRLGDLDPQVAKRILQDLQCAASPEGEDLNIPSQIIDMKGFSEEFEKALHIDGSAPRDDTA